MALRHEKFTAFRTKFVQNGYMLMPSELKNAPATIRRELNHILLPLPGIKWEINTKQELDMDDDMVMVAYIDDIVIATKGTIEKQHMQLSKVFELLKDNHIGNEFVKYIFDAEEVLFLGCLVSGTGIEMDPDKANAIVDWP
jgi:hypothetical protein